MQVNKMATFDVTIPAGTTLYTSIANRNACLHLHDMRRVEAHSPFTPPARVPAEGDNASVLFHTYPYAAIHSIFEFDDEPGMENAHWQIAVYTLKSSITVPMRLNHGPGAFFDHRARPHLYWSDELEGIAPPTNGYLHMPIGLCTHRLLNLNAVYNVADKQRFQNFAARLATVTGDELYDPVVLNFAAGDGPVVFSGYQWESWRSAVYSLDPHIMAGVLQPVRCGAPNRQDAADYPLVGLPAPRQAWLEGGGATLHRIRQQRK